jgi:putative redox protein
MVEMTVEYQGELRSTATHGPSKTKLNTDAPVDNMGKGESFSPTDLLAASLTTCMLTTMAIAASRNNINIGQPTAKVVKEMTTAPTRRVARLPMEIIVPAQLSDEERQKMRNAALTCPVAKSIHPDIEVPVTFYWGPTRVAESTDTRH